MKPEIVTVAVNALYDAREDDEVMDAAAELVAKAVLGHVAAELEERADEQKNRNGQRRVAYRNAAIHCREVAGIPFHVKPH